MKIEISEEQQKQLLAIISAAQIRGSEAPMVMSLARAIQTPTVDLKTVEEPKEKKDVKG